MFKDLFLQTRSSEEQELTTYHIFPSLAHYARLLTRTKAHVAALSKEPKFRQQVKELCEQFSEQTLDRGWPEFWSEDLDRILSSTLEGALELRPELVPRMPEEQLRLGFGLKQLAERWGLGCSNLSVRRIGELVGAIRGGGPVDVPAGLWAVEPKEIRLPGMRFLFYGGDESLERVSGFVSARIEERVAKQHETLGMKATGRGPSALLRDAEIYVMHLAGMSTKEILAEWQKRHPGDTSLLPDDTDLARKAIERVEDDLRDFLTEPVAPPSREEPQQ